MAPPSLPQASLPDSLRTVAEVVAPTIAKGVILRRPRAVSLAQRLDLDRRAVRQVQRLRDAYSPGPVLLSVPGPPRAVVLDPEPFATASTEKRAALSHFQPKGALVSHGPDRADRLPSTRPPRRSPGARRAGPGAG